MTQNESTQITGWGFIAAAVLFWLGWMLLPVKIEPFFKSSDFADVFAQFHLWIWMFRFHLFGVVIAAASLVALGSVITESPARILIWPGVAIAVVGLMVGACADAFYYHFGAWGALDMHGKSAEAIAAFVASLEVSTEYVTCLVRFGRVSGGFGMFSGMWPDEMECAAELHRWSRRPDRSGGHGADDGSTGRSSPL